MADKEPLEINGSERATFWSIGCFEEALSFQTFEDPKRSFVISGDIVYLKNQDTNAFLTVSSKELVLENIQLELEMDHNLE